MKNLGKFIKEILKQRHENAILDSILTFALYFFIIIAVVLVLMFVIKVLPWLVKQSGGPIYKLFAPRQKDNEIIETYHHIEKPLKRLRF